MKDRSHYVLYALRATLILTPFLFLAFGHAQSPREIRQFLVTWEGYTTRVVIRDNGERVVGVGHNLRYPAPLDPRKSTYTKEELDTAFAHDLKIATAACQRHIPNFDTLPIDARLVALSLAWTVGPTGLEQFRDFRAALGRRDYRTAAIALEKSEWARQVGMRRANDHCDRLIGLAK